MIDLHTHTTFSDGELIPSELVRRAESIGYSVLGITDHADYTNIEHILSCVSRIKYLEDVLDMRILVGVELTHVHPAKIGPLAGYARKLGAEIVVVHGETPVGPVRPGTNLAAIQADVDFPIHQGDGGWQRILGLNLCFHRPRQLQILRPRQAEPGSSACAASRPCARSAPPLPHGASRWAWNPSTGTSTSS